MKRILITGANSYIGKAVQEYLQKEPEQYLIKTIDTIGWNPQSDDFTDVDVVFNVAGIAHIKETKRNMHMYYDINRDLVIKIAKVAKEAGVKQFILLSTMSVYGIISGYIDKNTPVNPVNAYGDSKAQADEEIFRLEDENFRFACLRPPMVYGKGCKGNYQLLRLFALKVPFFPNYKNKRSMIYVDNLCEFVKMCIDEEKCGLFFPQNAEYVSTCQMVDEIAKNNGKKIRFVRLFNWIIRIIPISIVKKVFGDLTYERVDLVNKYEFVDSIRMTEK